MLQAVVGYLPDADGEAGADAGPGSGSESGPGSEPARADGAGGRQAGLAGSKGLEAALLGKARRLEHDLTMARLRISEACGASVRGLYSPCAST